MTEEATGTESMRILLVEDDLVNTQLATALLSGFGHTVIAAENGQEGVDLYRQFLEKDRFNLVLMDMEMPVMNGIDAAIEIRRLEGQFNEQHKGSGFRIPIAAMTANSGEEILVQCQAAGMDDAISKPVNRDMLKEIISRLVERQ